MGQDLSLFLKKTDTFHGSLDMQGGVKQGEQVYIQSCEKECLSLL